MAQQVHKAFKALLANLVQQDPPAQLLLLLALLVQLVLAHKARQDLQVLLDKMGTVIRLQAQQAIQLAMVKNHSLLVQACHTAKHKTLLLVLTAIL
jgi:hypothetical protein